MNKISLYKTNIRFSNENKYANHTILEENIGKAILVVDNPANISMGTTWITFTLKKDTFDLNPNYIKYELDTQTLYYFVNTIDYSTTTKQVTINGELDMWHTYIPNFYTQENISRKSLLEFKRATIKPDYIYTNTLYGNRYFSEIDANFSDLSNNIAYITEADGGYNTYCPSPYRDSLEIKNGSLTLKKDYLTFQTVNGINYGVKWDDLRQTKVDGFETVQCSREVYLFIFNGSKIPSEVPSANLQPNKYYFTIASQFENETLPYQNMCEFKVYNTATDVEIANVKYISAPVSLLMEHLPKENIVGVYKYPFNYYNIDLRRFPSAYFNLKVQDTIHVEGLNCYEVGGKSLNGFLNQTVGSEYDTHVIGGVNNNLFSYNTYQTFSDSHPPQKLRDYIPIDNPSTLPHQLLTFFTTSVFHSSLINHCSFVINNGLSEFEIPLINIWSMKTINFILTFDVVLFYSGAYFQCSIVPSQYEQLPYYSAKSIMSFHQVQYDLALPSTSNNWTNFLATNSATATTGYANQNLLTFGGIGMLAGALALAPELSPLLVGGAMLGMGNLANSYFQRYNQRQDIKHSPNMINSGSLSTAIINHQTSLAVTFKLPTEAEMERLSYHYKYFGNIVSTPMTLTQYQNDKAPNVNFMIINDFGRVWTDCKSLTIKRYFDELFNNGVRIWEVAIDIT